MSISPAAAVESGAGIVQLHREFMSAGSNVVQALAFNAEHHAMLGITGNATAVAAAKAAADYSCQMMNEKSCDIARKVAKEGKDVMVSGGISQSPVYLAGGTKEECQKEYAKRLDVFEKKGLDFLIAEYYEHIEECEWAIESCLKTGIPVAASMCIGPSGDLTGVSVEECTRRMVDAGAHIVGLNCHFDPFVSLEVMRRVKTTLEEMGKIDEVHMMIQPIAFMSGATDNYALEPRLCSEQEIQLYARAAYDLGIRYIGGSCGFEPHLIQAVAQELAVERNNKQTGTNVANNKLQVPMGSASAVNSFPQMSSAIGFSLI